MVIFKSKENLGNIIGYTVLDKTSTTEEQVWFLKI